MRQLRAVRAGGRITPRAVTGTHMDVPLGVAVTLVVPLAARFVITGRFICLARPGRRKGTASTVTEAPVAEV
jgi:hypothetical protein